MHSEAFSVGEAVMVPDKFKQGQITPGNAGILDLSRFAGDNRAGRRQALLSDIRQRVGNLGPNAKNSQVLGQSLGAGLGAGFLEGIGIDKRASVEETRKGILSLVDTGDSDSLQEAITRARSAGDEEMALGLAANLENLLRGQSAQATAQANARSLGEANAVKRDLAERKQSLAERAQVTATGLKRDEMAFKKKDASDKSVLNWAKFNLAKDTAAETGVSEGMSPKDISILNAKNPGPVKAAMLAQGYTIDQEWPQEVLKSAQVSLNSQERDKRVASIVEKVDVMDIGLARAFLEETDNAPFWDLTGVDKLDSMDLANRAAALLVDHPEMVLSDRFRLAVGAEPQGVRPIALTDSAVSALMEKGRGNLTAQEKAQLAEYRRNL